MALVWPFKDPDDVLDYEADWEPAVNAAPASGDTIIAAEFIVEAGTVVIDSTLFTDYTATAWISGGVDGEQAEIVSRVTTAQGRIMDQTFKLKVKTR